ncbi:hypothetical protein BB560_001368 [Smittium megazygosporum]|uniref:Ribosome assembly protein 3 n=1 Tax=Smittium megazygosporum TaxID=133381 RepID=A0A2T9ZI00_9FUNG|nr:hypothetical protein BB560_001368 [Smittium megazygosporum]
MDSPIDSDHSSHISDSDSDSDSISSCFSTHSIDALSSGSEAEAEAEAKSGAESGSDSDSHLSDHSIHKTSKDPNKGTPKQTQFDSPFETTLKNGQDIFSKLDDPDFQTVLSTSEKLFEKSKQNNNNIVTNFDLINELKLCDTENGIQNTMKSGFKALYMDAMTNAFGDELNLLRHSENLDSNKLELLVSSLQSGINIFENDDLSLK